MKIQVVISSLLVLAVVLPGPITQASTQRKAKIKAAYLIIPDHVDTLSLSHAFPGPIITESFSFEHVGTWSELNALITTGGVDVVFVACPPAMDAILAKTDFMQTSKVTTDNNSLLDVSGPVMAQLPSQDQNLKNDPHKTTNPSVMQTSEISPVMQRIINNRLKIIQRYATDPLIINTVRKQNAKAADMEKIKQIDKKWIAGEEDKFIKTVLNSNASKYLRGKVRSNKLLYGEAFLCDRQGALVGAYPRTSDYWQGDEGKFTDCFNKGNSRVVIGPLEFDKSTKSYSVQVSVPVKDADETIGVLIVGLKNVGQSTVTKNF
ncbi:MAG: PDC sensor domain-containing protein [Planctomycetota bacterium]|jgi:hypothetical protein